MNRCAVALVLVVAACTRKSASATDTTLPRADTTAPVAPAGTAPADTEHSAVGSGKAGQGTSSTSAKDANTGATKSIVATTASDTLRGVVAVTGTDRDKHVIIKPAGGGRSVTLSGPEAATVARAAGADVLVTGTRDASGSMVVSSFVVRTVDGAAATDGTLALEGGKLVLVTPNGERHPIAHAPPALRDHVGARAWISGDLSKGPAAWGIITDKR